MNRLMFVITFLVFCVASHAAHAQKTISFKTVREASNFSDTGLNIGNDGFLFANFGAGAPETNQPINSNVRNLLPAWVSPVVLDDPTSENYPFNDFVFATGGQQGWATLTLPDGETGLSGAFVDPETADNSNNTIPMLNLGPGTPPAFLFHVVVDNTNKENDSANRIRARAESGDGLFDEAFRVNTSTDDFDGSPDVYTFRYDGWESGDFIKLQLNSGVGGVPASITGVMFDVVPEPTSLLLSAVALFGLFGCAARCRK